MRLSKRLEAVASFVEQGSCAADIGTDHGYVPIYLVEHGIAEYAIAADVKQGPLRKAQNNIEEAGLKAQIETRLSDGLLEIRPGEADTVIIAGMGGELMIHILEEGRFMWDSVKQWVLSPHSDLFRVRSFLSQNGFGIGREAMIYEEGKYYTVLDVKRRQGLADKVRYGSLAMEKKVPELIYGGYLIQTKNQVLLEYLAWEEAKFESLAEQLRHAPEMTERMRLSLREIERKLMWNREVQNEMRECD